MSIEDMFDRVLTGSPRYFYTVEPDTFREHIRPVMRDFRGNLWIDLEDRKVKISDFKGTVLGEVPSSLELSRLKVLRGNK